MGLNTVINISTLMKIFVLFFFLFVITYFLKEEEKIMFLKKIKSKKGAALVEYGILVGLIAVLVISSVIGFGGEAKRVFEDVSTTLDENINNREDVNVASVSSGGALDMSNDVSDRSSVRDSGGSAQTLSMRTPFETEMFEGESGDYFTFEVPGSQQADVTIAMTKNFETSSVLYNDLDDRINLSPYVSSSDHSVTLQLPPGIYYYDVQRGAGPNNFGEYTIVVSYDYSSMGL